MTTIRHETFGTFLQRQLADMGMTYTDLANMTGATQAMVSNWANDKKKPSPRYCDKIAEVMALDVDEVLIRAGHRPRLVTDGPEELRELAEILRQLPDDEYPEVRSFLRWRLERARQRRARPTGE